MEFSKKEAGADDDICAWIYLLDILQENEKIITYKSGNKTCRILWIFKRKFK